jgi:hypothetical protein
MRVSDNPMLCWVGLAYPLLRTCLHHAQVTNGTGHHYTAQNLLHLHCAHSQLVPLAWCWGRQWTLPAPVPPSCLRSPPSPPSTHRSRYQDKWAGSCRASTVNGQLLHGQEKDTCGRLGEGKASLLSFSHVCAIQPSETLSSLCVPFSPPPSLSCGTHAGTYWWVGG